MYRKLLKISKKFVPRISETERIALKSGTVSIDKNIFSGKLTTQSLINDFRYHKVPVDSPVNHAVHDFCSNIDDTEIFEKKEIPKEVYKNIGKAGLYGMIIPKEYGGLELSHTEQSQYVQKIATASGPVGITVMVPNSLGPAELLLKYGTEQQKKDLLPKLANGTLIPCFGLTGPHSGSDAASMRDTGVVFEKDGKKYIKLNLFKRYITLAPIANLVGVAFILSDPNKHLKEGITLSLLDRNLLTIGKCHHPMDIPFKNGTVEANDLVVPIETIIGGEEYAGHGWKMLMECLSVGRAISLPACAVGSAKLTTNYVGAYAVYRKQFKTILADMEGVQQKLASIASETLKITSMQYLTNSILETGAKPSVISAIMKYETTERSRQVVNDGMDIVGGAGICKGPRNILANVYQTIPIGITVEGSNILTKNLIIFGQGLMKSHPHLYNIVESIEKDDEKKFEENLKNIILHSLSNIKSSIFHKVYSSESTLIDKYTANFAITSNLILLLGKKFKTNELTSGRMAEILGSIYIYHSLSWFQHHNPEVKNIVKLAQYEELQKIQKNFENVANNYPIFPINLFLKVILSKPLFSHNINIRITDEMIKNASNSITKDMKVREILSENIFQNPRLKLMNDNLEEILKYNSENGNKNDNEKLNNIIDEIIKVDVFDK